MSEATKAMEEGSPDGMGRGDSAVGSKQGVDGSLSGEARRDRVASRGLRVAWIVTPLSARGGTVTHLRHWANGLEGTSITPVLLYYCPEDGTGARLELPPSLEKRHLRALEPGLGSFHRAIRESVQALRDYEVDIIHSIFIFSDLVALLASRITGLPVMSSVEGRLFVSHLGRFRKTALSMAYRALARRFSRVTAVSVDSAEMVRRFLPPGAVEVMYPGLVPSRFVCRQRSASMGGDSGGNARGPKLVYVGRLSPIKRLDRLILAVSRLVRVFPKLRVALVGDGPERDMVERAISAQQLGRHATITGWLPVSEVEAQIREADLLALTSDHEGVPWAVLEAMSQGVPVVATRVGGLPELIVEAPEGCRTGFLVEPDDGSRFAEVVEEILCGPDAQANLAEVALRARARVETLFCRDREIDQLVRLYRWVSGRRSAGGMDR